MPRKSLLQVCDFSYMLHCKRCAHIWYIVTSTARDAQTLPLSRGQSIRRHHCQRLMGLLHNTNAELCVYGRLIHTLNVPCAIIYLTILIYGTGYVVKLYLSVRV